ncbi:MAG: thiamine pyrophosphate-binding protein [Leptospiraceae bacterium]|nr:thiamine pyrophosphate-binding protein [Leptospiraceae bacterium]MCB1305928.1 thiamine pyrophosphate-binding protein [Leptospiraceae bacterium]
MNGGEIIARTLHNHGVEFVFTLIGGHVSPVLVGCEKLGIRVIDVRHEANAVFAADAVSRLSGIPGVAVVTAGPGLTNTITALKNAQMAQSPLVLIGGATATILKGRGALQDIDQLAIIKSCVKRIYSIRKISELPDAMNQAFRIAREGVPGPVFIETPVDLLYPEDVVREWYAASTPKGSSLQSRALRSYIQFHLHRQFSGKSGLAIGEPLPVSEMPASSGSIQTAIKAIQAANRPLLLIGSQALLHPEDVDRLVAAVELLQIPVYLAGMARGLLGAHHPLQLRHKRSQSLASADLVILAGLPNDFRLNYGAQIKKHAYHIGVNRSKKDLTQNKRPDLAIQADPGNFLIELAKHFPESQNGWPVWLEELRQQDNQRNEDIRSRKPAGRLIDPVDFFLEMDRHLSTDSILVVDGGDFVATSAYTLSPRQPLSWLDPGVFGTLGVGAGFALGAKLLRPSADVYIIYGDGSAGYSLMEYDTFVRHKVPIISIIGNDACWSQIYRDQVDILGSDVGCMLDRSDYEKIGPALGAEGKRIARKSDIARVLKDSRTLARKGKPVIVNVHIGRSDFRKGSISI